MAGTFKFELVSPEKVLLSDDASEAIVPGSDGEFTVLEGHAPVISTMRPGRLTVKLDGRDRVVFVRGGIVEVEPHSLTILAQHLIDLDSPDRGEAISTEIKAAEAMLAASQDDIERMAAEDTLSHLRELSTR